MNTGMDALYSQVEQAIRQHKEFLNVGNSVMETEVRHAIRWIMRDNPDVFWFVHQYYFDKDNGIVSFGYRCFPKRCAIIQESFDGRSTGFPKIRQALRQNGSPEPVLETDERNSYFLAHLGIHPAFKGVSQDVHKGVHQDVYQVNLDVWIEEQIRKNPNITIKEMGKLSGMNSKAIHRHIIKLPHIRYVGSGYSGHWEISKEVLQ